MSENDPPTPEFDWRATSFDGARREQLRRWAQLPLENILLAIEEMQEIAVMLNPPRRPDAESGRERGIMSSYTLTRTGQAPLAFEGEEITHVDGKSVRGREQNRWHDLAVYRTAGGKYVLHIEYHTQWQGEQGVAHAILLGTDTVSLSEELQRYNPMAHVHGYPPGPLYEEKQARLLDSITQRYECQVSELLSDIPGAEERID